jgi:hypothetical protein
LQGINDQFFGGLQPADQIDALPTERINNIFDSQATHANTGSDGIHMRVMAIHGELAAVAGLARDGLDLDGSGSDLRDLLSEEANNLAGVVWHVVASRENTDGLAAEFSANMVSASVDCQVAAKYADASSA